MGFKLQVKFFYALIKILTAAISVDFEFAKYTMIMALLSFGNIIQATLQNTQNIVPYRYIAWSLSVTKSGTYYQVYCPFSMSANWQTLNDNPCMGFRM